MAQTQAGTAARKSVGQNVSATRRVSRLRRHARLRKKIEGTPERPRLVVHRSARHIHVQLVNDENGTTVAAASSIEADVRGLDGDKKAHSVRVGQLIAERAKAAGCEWLHVDFEDHLRGFYFGSCGFKPTNAGLVHLKGD